MAEELLVVLNRSEHLGFGFSLLGTAGLPHIIYDIVENSPAAECGEVSPFLRNVVIQRFLYIKCHTVRLLTLCQFHVTFVYK